MVLIFVVLTLPLITLPATVKLVNNPTEVILGCALAVTVTAVQAAPALLAYAALATVPVTLAPLMFVIPAPLPNILPVISLALIVATDNVLALMLLILALPANILPQRNNGVPKSTAKSRYGATRTSVIQPP